MSHTEDMRKLLNQIEESSTKVLNESLDPKKIWAMVDQNQTDEAIDAGAMWGAHDKEQADKSAAATAELNNKIQLVVRLIDDKVNKKDKDVKIKVSDDLLEISIPCWWFVDRTRGLVTWSWTSDRMSPFVTWRERDQEKAVDAIRDIYKQQGWTFSQYADKLMLANVRKR